MKPLPPVEVSAGPASGVIAPDDTMLRWIDLLVADDEWVQAEFEAIVAAGWGGVMPPCPAPRQGAHGPRRPGSDVRPTPVRYPAELLLSGRTRPRQRGPPA